MTTPGFNELFLRSHLDAKKAHLKSFALSPDIIPQYGLVVTAASLEKSYDNFINLPLVPQEDNNIYVRAISVPITHEIAKSTPPVKPQRASVTLRAVPSELILWPQVWNKSELLEPGPVLFDVPDADILTASGIPFTYRPEDLGGIHHSLIAIHDPLLPGQLESEKRFRDTLPPPPPDCDNWREYYNWMQIDKRVTYSNVWVADPTATIISISTRLRIFENEEDTVNLALFIQQAGLPPATEVSLSCDSGKIYMERKPIGDGSGEFGVNVTLPHGFDGIINLNVFPPDDGRALQGYSWISLQANAVVFDEDGNATYSLLGSENIVFEANATRQLRFARTANKSSLPTLGDPASAWWFRDSMGDTNDFPRSKLFSCSPDIQLVGPKPDSNAQTDLGGSNSGTDYTSNHSITVSNGQANYIYLRGNCASDKTNVESRAYAIPCNVAVHPSKYGDNSIMGVDKHGDPIIEVQQLTTNGANTFSVFGTPFNLSDPPDPKSLGSDHYCVVAETRVVTDKIPDPKWPHEKTGDFATLTDFVNWILSNPSVTFRNITWVPNSSAATQIFRTCLTIQHMKGSPTDEIWLFANADNAPPDSEWALTAAGDAIPGVNIGFERTKLGSPNAVNGVHITGIPLENYDIQLSLQWWWSGAVDSGFKISFNVGMGSEDLILPSNSNKGSRLPKSSRNWPHLIGDAHPGLPSGVNLSGNRPLVPPIKGRTKHRRASRMKVGASDDDVDDDPPVLVYGADTWCLKK